MPKPQTAKAVAFAIGHVVTLTAPRTFPALTQNGIERFTLNAGVSLQVTACDHTGVGLEVYRSGFYTWVSRATVRPATDHERDDFKIGECGPRDKETRVSDAPRQPARYIAPPAPIAAAIPQAGLFGV